MTQIANRRTFHRAGIKNPSAGRILASSTFAKIFWGSKRIKKKRASAVDNDWLRSTTCKDFAAEWWGEVNILVDVSEFWHLGDGCYNQTILAFVACDESFIKPGEQHSISWVREAFLGTEVIPSD